MAHALHPSQGNPVFQFAIRHLYLFSIKEAASYTGSFSGVKFFNFEKPLRSLAGWIKKAQILKEAWAMKKRFRGMIFTVIPVVMILTITVTSPVMDIWPEGSLSEAHNRIRLTASAWARELPDWPEQSIIPAEIDIGQLESEALHKGSVPLQVDTTAQPLLSVDPYHLDFGSAVQGEQISRRVRVTNKGWDTLRWRAAAGGITDPHQGRAFSAGKYVSFLNEELTGRGHYTVARHLKDKLELPGKWGENQGYPLSLSDGQTLRYHFSGTGVAVYFWKGPATGQLTAFVDDRFVFQQEGFSEKRERFEWEVARELADGAHVLMLINRNAPVAVEGVRIYGDDITPLNPESIAISPDNGAVTRQTNYVNITVNTTSLAPGHYGGYVLFDSNGGQKEIELSLDVMADNIPRTLDVYRYVRNLDYFLTTNPQAESAALQARGYTKQGIAFRLFSPGTPGTTEFYRWFHTQKDDHFYGYEIKSVKRPMQGYILEGTIGNIATSRLTHTRELYRWYNPSSRHYFFSVDPKGEGIEKKGYRYDGIAGYVKP